MQSINKLKKSLRPVFTKRKIIKAILFGSMARGTEGRISDVDLIIIMNTDKRFLKRFDYFMEIYNLIDGAVDMLIYTPDELKHISHRSFIKKALREGVVIYGN